MAMKAGLKQNKMMTIKWPSCMSSATYDRFEAKFVTFVGSAITEKGFPVLNVLNCHKHQQA